MNVVESQDRSIEEIATDLDSVRASIRRLGLKATLYFAVVVLIVILAFKPPNIFIALVFPVVWLVLATLALKATEKTQQLLSFVIAAQSVLLFYPLVLANGLLPAVLLPLGFLVPLSLSFGWLRNTFLALAVLSGFLVPFSSTDYDPAVWARLMVTNVILGGALFALIRYVEDLMVKNHDHVFRLNRVLERERIINDELLDKQQKQNQLFAIIGHELRTPLASLKMMQDAMDLRQAGDFGPNICDTTDNLLNIVDDLRSVINPDQAHQSQVVVDSPFDVVMRTTKSLEGLYAERSVNVQVFSNQLSHTGCLFNAQALRQIITNLTKNAAIHAEANTVWVDLKATARGDEQIDVTLRVEDNGKGIPDTLRSSVFEAFNRGETQADGTGLGLYVARDLTQRLGGDVTYFDSDNGGAGFTVTMTLNRHRDAGLEETIEETVSLQGQRILFAEDQKTLQLLTMKLLKDRGADVVVCDNGQQALDAYRLGEFDVVLTDMMMPEMSGDEFIRHLRDEGFAGQIFGLTAATIGQEVQTMLDAGADAVFHKPFKLNEMTQAMMDFKTAQ